MLFRTKPSNTPQGVLAKLWRKVITENNLQNSLGYLVTRYVVANSDESRTLRNKTRSTLESDISSKEMTWKKFVHLVFNYLGAIKMDIAIKLYFTNGTTSMHNISMTVSENEANTVMEDAKEASKKDKE